MFKVTQTWIVENVTERGGWKAKQLAAIGVQWPPERGWKLRSEGKMISEEQKAIFESFAGTMLGKPIRGKFYQPSGDCGQCCEPWETCSWPCPDAIQP